MLIHIGTYFPLSCKLVYMETLDFNTVLHLEYLKRLLLYKKVKDHDKRHYITTRHLNATYKLCGVQYESCVVCLLYFSFGIIIVALDIPSSHVHLGC
jgi:hypothetical protein